MSDNNNIYMDDFIVAFKTNLKDMAGIDCAEGAVNPQTGSFNSQGMTVIIGVTGKRHGRIIIDTSFEIAQRLGELINEETGIDKQLTIDTFAEFANIVCGHTVTRINNANKKLGLMLTPPSMFLGSNVTIISPKIYAQFVEFSNVLGNVNVSIGFEGVNKWM